MQADFVRKVFTTMAEKRTQEYTNIRVMRDTHTKLKAIIERLGTSWMRLLDAISLMTDEQVDTILRPLMEKYDETKGISTHMLIKKLKGLKANNPEELKKFIDSL